MKKYEVIIYRNNEDGACLAKASELAGKAITNRSIYQQRNTEGQWEINVCVVASPFYFCF